MRILITFFLLILTFSVFAVNRTNKMEGKVTNFAFKVSKAFIKPGFRLASNGKLYAVLIPLVDISPNLKAAYEKAIELINKGKISANNIEVEHIIDGKSIKGKLTEVPPSRFVSSRTEMIVRIPELKKIK